MRSILKGRRLRVGAVLVAMAVTVTGCIGGSSDTAAPDPVAGLPRVDLDASNSMLVAAVERTNELQSYRFAMLVALSAPELGLDEIRFEVDGVMDPVRNLGEFTMDMSSLIDMMPANQRDQASDMFGDGEIRVVQAGSTVYMRFPMLTRMMGASNEWIAVQGAGATQAMSTAGLAFQDPGSLMADLMSSVEVVEVGPANVSGVDTTMFQVTLDGELVDPTGLLGGDLPLMVWIDDRGVVRRVEMQFDIMGMTGGLVMEMSDFGVDVDVDIPSDALVVDASVFG